MDAIEALRVVLIHGKRPDLAQLLERARLVLKPEEPAYPGRAFPVPTVALILTPVEDYQHLWLRSKDDYDEVLWSLLEIHDPFVTGERITKIRYHIDPERPTADAALERAAGGAEEHALRHRNSDTGAGPASLPRQLAEDYVTFGYLCQDRVFTGGMMKTTRGKIKKARNLVEVNGSEVAIADSLFLLMLRFVVELKKGQGGWISRYDLFTEKIVGDSEDFRPYSNLRAPLEAHLLGKAGQDFVQNRGDGHYRVSTHPDLVTYDKEKLLLHPGQRVKDLAERLP